GVADHGRGIVREDARHRREVADVAVDDAEEPDDGLLVGRDRIEVAHAVTGYRFCRRAQSPLTATAGCLLQQPAGMRTPVGSLLSLTRSIPSPSSRPTKVRAA